MRAILQQLYILIRDNLSFLETVILIAFGMIVWFCRRYKCWLPTVYAVFLILYVTLFRRASGYYGSIQLHLKLWSNVRIWAGNLLNIFLYIPFGWMTHTWKQDGKRIVFAGFLLSIFCEVIQYFTGRGMADINDVLFNTLGAVIGVWLAGH